MLGKSTRWIRQLTQDKALRQVSRGKYNLADSVQAYIVYMAGGREEDGKPRFIDHKTEHERIKTEISSLELVVMRNDLLAAQDVKAVMNDMLTVCRQRISSIPTKIAPQLIGIDDVNTIKSRLSKEIHEVLTELSNFNPELYKNDETEGIGAER
jgi:hypothetical protein